MDNYEKAIYNRGRLDGMGRSDRCTGKSFRSIISSLLYASYGDHVFYYACSKVQAKYQKNKAIKIAESYDYAFRVTENKVIFFNGGSITFEANGMFNPVRFKGLSIDRNIVIIDDVDGKK